MRAIVITPALRQVEARDISATLPSLQAIVQGHIEGVYPGRFDPEWGDHHLYVNEEGLFKREFQLYPWAIPPGYPHLVGPAVVLASTRSGDEAGCTLSVPFVRSRLNWMFGEGS